MLCEFFESIRNLFVFLLVSSIVGLIVLKLNLAIVEVSNGGLTGAGKHEVGHAKLGSGIDGSVEGVGSLLEVRGLILGEPVVGGGAGWALAIVGAQILSRDCRNLSFNISNILN